MAKEKFDRTLQHVNIGTIGHVDHDILTKLKQRYKLGCVTNGPASTQNAKIDRLGLRGFFDTVLVSETFGVKKPDKRIYEQAARDLNLECREIAFVGDTFCTDIVGAVRAGMRNIPNALLLSVESLNVYDIVNADKIVFTEKAAAKAGEVLA